MNPGLEVQVAELSLNIKELFSRLSVYEAERIGEYGLKPHRIHDHTLHQGGVLPSSSIPGFHAQVHAFSGADHTGVGTELFVYKGVTESVSNSTTLQNDDTFVNLALPNNTTWMLKYYLALDDSANGGLANFKYNWAVTNAAGHSWNLITSFNGGLTGDADFAWPSQFTAAIAAAHPQVMCEHTVICGVSGGAGSVTLQWAQNVAQGFNTSILGGSFMIGKRIA